MDYRRRLHFPITRYYKLGVIMYRRNFKPAETPNVFAMIQQEQPALPPNIFLFVLLDDQNNAIVIEHIRHCA